MGKKIVSAGAENGASDRALGGEKFCCSANKYYKMMLDG